MRSALACLVLALALPAACSSPASKPPPLPGGQGVGGDVCVPGNGCLAGSYCNAVADAGCHFLSCQNGSWACVADAGVAADASVDASPGDAALPDAGGDGEGGRAADASADGAATRDAPGQ